jgi:hypothetical protein
MALIGFKTMSRNYSVFTWQIILPPISLVLPTLIRNTKYKLIIKLITEMDGKITRC